MRRRSAQPSQPDERRLVHMPARSGAEHDHGDGLLLCLSTGYICILVNSVLGLPRRVYCGVITMMMIFVLIMLTVHIVPATNDHGFSGSYSYSASQRSVWVWAWAADMHGMQWARLQLQW